MKKVKFLPKKLVNYLVNKNKVFIFVTEMVIISSTKVIKKVINKRTKLTF